MRSDVQDTRTSPWIRYSSTLYVLYLDLEDCGRGSIPPSHPHTTMPLPPLVRTWRSCTANGMQPPWHGRDILGFLCRQTQDDKRASKLPTRAMLALPYSTTGMWSSTPHSRSVRGSGSGRPYAHLLTPALRCCVERERLRLSQPLDTAVNRALTA